MFDKFKQDCLGKLDKSKKGSVDQEALILINKLNSLPDYCTTSSCAGRVMIVRSGVRKDEQEWLLQQHDCRGSYITGDELRIIIGDYGDVWFKMEPSIFHVCCRDLDIALDLLNKVRSVGYKKGGIQTVGKKIMVEFVAPERMETIIMKDGKLLVDEMYVNLLFSEADKRLQKTQERIRRVVELFPL